MSSPFQNINAVSQMAVSNAKQFITQHEQEFTEDDVEFYVDSMLFHPEYEELRSYWETVFRATLDAFNDLFGEDDEDDED